MSKSNNKMSPCASRNWERIKMRLGYKCAVPGCNCTVNLQLDHIEPTTKSFDVKSRLSYKWVNLIEEVDKCQFLCPYHHKEKTYNKDWETIQVKKKEFMYVSHRFDPILQEHMCDITIDQNKKDGRAYIKFVEYIAKKKGVDFWDIVKEHNEEHRNYNHFHFLQIWDTIDFSNMECSIEEMEEYKEYLEKKIAKLKKEKPELYEIYENTYFERDKKSESLTKMVNRIVENDT
tara:strand:+ start:273 stop:968 length:696 start_codon:yes stop_codon:yes gene_type:complete